MGFATAFKKLASGDLKGSVDWLFIDEENAARGDAASSRLQSIIQEQAASGAIPHEEALASYARIQGSATDALLDNPEFSPYVGFQEKLSEEFDAVMSGTKKTASAVFGLPFKILPWQFWLLIAAAIAVYTFPFWAPLLRRLMGSAK